jgi:Papain family cysteine protease
MQTDTPETKIYESLYILKHILINTFFIKDYDIIPIDNQTTNDCVGCVVSYLINYDLATKYDLKYNKINNNYDLITKNIIRPEKPIFISAEEIYNIARKIDDIPFNDNADVGTTIYYGFESVKKNLIPISLKLSSQKDYQTRINLSLYYGINYFSVGKNLNLIKHYLCTNRPIALGINISNQIFELKYGDILRCPRSISEIIGGHAIVLVGYINELNAFIARNSFGVKFCANGYFLISYNYILSSFSYDLFVLGKL